MDENPAAYFKFHRHAAHVRAMERKHKDKAFTPMTVEVYWGAPGTGKTRKAHEDDPDLYMLPSGSSGTVWWDGYDPVAHKTILIDDFYGGAIKYGLLLKLLDGYRFNLPVKGGYVWKSYTRVILTSNKSIDEWYPSEVDISALKRRITKCTHFN